jgi:hypothetical protein
MTYASGAGECQSGRLKKKGLNGSGIHLSGRKPRASEVDMYGFAEGRVLIDATRKTAHGVVYFLITLVTRIGIEANPSRTTPVTCFPLLRSVNLATRKKGRVSKFLPETQD